MFDKILIANRGEIAVRVMRTARRLGIATVAVYSDADAGALHVEMADEAVAIGAAPAAESYLVSEKIIDAALRTGAQAVHPGYGFLSENADFADACASNNIVFIGPPAAAIREMGEKAAAKARMEAAGVPVVPGYHGAEQGDDELQAEAEKIGYPVLIKAVSGGGGRGMRRVDGGGKFSTELQSARREAKNAFGDDKVLIEKYLLRSRHVEVQVFADAEGNVVHLFERDCSVQRRHQKVIEEAPAPGMSREMRQTMGQAAVAAARAIGYVGAGTVEFIADVTDGLRQDRYYFMEMNTRLQVEHPVTEMITGQDLVEWQLRVAAGEPLPLAQEELSISGHAVEARIYAENPAKKFFPSSGPLLRLRQPDEGPHLRVDSGVREGDEVSIYYDPMIAKLIAWDHDRAAALRRLRSGLASFQVAGVMNNVDFLSAVAGHPAFLDGDLETGFIEQHSDELMPPAAAAGDRILAIATLDVLVNRREAAAGSAAESGDPYSPWATTDGWRLNDTGYDLLHFEDAGGEVEIRVDYQGGDRYRFELPGGSVAAAAERDGDGSLSVDLDGVRSNVAVIRQDDSIVVFADGRTWRLKRSDPMNLVDVDTDVLADIAAPLPGKIIQVIGEAGQAVEKGAPLLILEAMKMEHTITAPAAGKIREIFFAAGDQVG